LQYEVLASGGEFVGTPELAHVPDALAHLLGLAGDVDAGHRGAPAVDREQRGQHAQCRRLAGSVRAEEAEDLSLPDLDADAPHRLDGPASRVELLT